MLRAGRLPSMHTSSSSRVSAICRHVCPAPDESPQDWARQSSWGPAGTASSSSSAEGRTFPKLDVLRDFISDPAWAGKPFWMLNVLKFKDQAKYQEYLKLMRDDALPKIGAKIVFWGYSRTVIGKIHYDAVAIVEYPSPEVFFKMASSPEQAAKNSVRLAGLEEQYLIPLRPGWFHLDRAAPVPTEQIRHFSAEAARQTKNGMVGVEVEGARPGETSATLDQAADFASDGRLQSGRLWHLNLLRFAGGEGKRLYDTYAKAMGGRHGVLSRYGARSTLATECYRSLMGEVNFDQAIIAEYPSRDAFLSMGASADYMRTAHFRHQGLQDTYIISCLPEFVDG